MAKRTGEWFRPISWMGGMRAFSVVAHGRINRVPDPHGCGGSIALIPSAEDLCGEWEVVSPKDVNNGR